MEHILSSREQRNLWGAAETLDNGDTVFIGFYKKHGFIVANVEETKQQTGLVELHQFVDTDVYAVLLKLKQQWEKLHVEQIDPDTLFILEVH